MPLHLFHSGSDDEHRPRRAGEPAAAAVGDEENSLRFTGVSGLVFDMGDVLFDATVWRRWLLQLLARMGLQAGYKSFFSIWDRDYLDAVHRGERGHAEAFAAFLRHSGLTAGQIDEVMHASNLRKRELEAGIRPFPNVRSTLWRLHSAGIRLAVLSDSELSGDDIRARLEHMGIGGCFAAVVSSADLRLTKPAPECYRRAIELLGLRARQTAFVGHDAHELHGARRAGMRTVAVNFDRDVVAEKYLSRFDDLLPLFEYSSSAALRRRGAA